jgi:hypothetical protein
MAITYALIQSITLSSNTSAITFTSIPQTFTDLVVNLVAKTNVGGSVDGIRVSLNGTDVYPSGNSTRFYTAENDLFANGSYNNIAIPGNPSGYAAMYGSAEIYFGQYTVSGKQKLFLANSAIPRFGDPTSFSMVGSGSVAMTDAITSISFGNFDSGGNAFLTGSSAYLYGIKRN